MLAWKVRHNSEGLRRSFLEDSAILRLKQPAFTPQGAFPALPSAILRLCFPDSTPQGAFLAAASVVLRLKKPVLRLRAQFLEDPLWFCASGLVF